MLLLGAIAGLLTVLGANVAIANVDSGEPQVPFLVPVSEPLGLNEVAQAGESTPIADAYAAAELPHSDLTRDGAEELLESVFPSSVEEAAGIFNELEVEAFHSDHVAVVAPDDSAAQPGLLTSLLPLRVENAEGGKELVDLGLERLDGTLQPTNPLVQVEIPSVLDDGVRIPESGISVEINGDGSRVASIGENGAAFYPNIASDSDLAVAATPTGFETFTQLRSADSPRTQTMRLNLPAGGGIKEAAGGGATITDGGKPVGAVRPPSAIDAEGEPVAVSLSVNADSITITASPSPDAAYPILVDPIFDFYSWMNSNTNTGIYSDWLPASTNEAMLKPSWVGVWNQQMHAGLNLRSYSGAVAFGSQANWNYFVPRYFTDYQSLEERPTSFIRSMTFSQVYYILEESAPIHGSPSLVVGLWDGKIGKWQWEASHNGTQGAYNGVSFSMTNPAEIVDVKNGGIALMAYETTSYPRQAFVGQATVEVADNDLPNYGYHLNPDGWMNAVPLPITYAATDKGLGVYALSVTQPNAAGAPTTISTSSQCLGTASDPCPRTVNSSTRPLLYEPKYLPQGEDFMPVAVTDPVGHQQADAQSVKVKVDHTKPTLASLSGTATEQGTLGTWKPSYTVKYSAADGDEAAAAALAPIAPAGEGKLQRPMGVAIDSAGNVWVIDRENSRVEKFDAAGNLLLQFGKAGSGNGEFSDPRGIAVSASGNVWVSEIGNKRLQEFKSNGEFIRKVTNARFVEPYGLATGPGETVWVTDPAAHNVFQFNESGTYQRSAHEGLFSGPIGIATDPAGNAWVADSATHQVKKLDPTANYVMQFGSEGTGNGQFKVPVGVAVAPSGHLFVVDSGNGRVEEFKPDGTYLRQFGSAGAGEGQLSEPRGMAFGANGVAYVADAANKRIARWSHADLDPQSGVTKAEIKVDGSVVSGATYTPGCAGTKNCAISGNEWTLDANKFSAGQHTLEVIATDGVGLSTTSASIKFESHPDKTAPSIALSGTMTEQATLGTTRPKYALKVAATDPGGAEERKSGVAAVTIKVDGTIVKATSPGCPAEGCSLNQEWALESSKYSAGSHTVEAIATDGAGLTTTKTLTINIAEDTTAPKITEIGDIFTAPEGWVEQKNYFFIAYAEDSKGYGTSSLIFKIDGKTVFSESAPCPEGECMLFLFKNLDMTTYKGGEHPAELIATDGAGNVSKKAWMINVDPKGAIGVSEAEDTLEAAEETSQLDLLSTDPSDPSLSQSGQELVSSDAPVQSTISLDPSSGAELGTINGTASIVPTATGSAASATGLSVNRSAAISTNTAATVDTITKPIYDGSMMFKSIRDTSGPEEYSWTVLMSSDQSLELVDDHYAEVYTDGDVPSLGILAEEAHDATGAAVPTSLHVSGSTITLTVNHRAGNPSAGGIPFVYPVTVGTGWEGGFHTIIGELPPGEPASTEVMWGGYESVTAPEPPNPKEDPEASASSNAHVYDVGPKRRFQWVICGHPLKFYTAENIEEFSSLSASNDPALEFGCGHPWANDPGKQVLWRSAMAGKFFQKTGSNHSAFETWHEGGVEDSIGCLANGNTTPGIGGTLRRAKVASCRWWGETSNTRPNHAPWGKHLTAVVRSVGEERAACEGEGVCNGTPNPWQVVNIPSLAYYFWASGNYSPHITACIDC